MKSIEIYNLYKQYPKVKRYRDIFLHPFKKDYIKAVNGIDLTVEKGTMLGLLGPNGAGKTTLIKILATLVLPTSGTVNVHNYDIVKHSRKIRKIIGFVTADERSFFWRLTGIQNLEFFATLNNLSSSETKRRVHETLEQTELTEAANMMFKDYSTGMKQRLAIARGLLCYPDILLLDEPTRSLDPFSAQKLRHFITQKIIQKLGHTAIIATHNLHEAYEMCSHVAVMQDGVIIEHGEKNNVFRNTITDTFLLTLSHSSPDINFGNIHEITEHKILNEHTRTYSIITENIEQVLHTLYTSGVSIIECKKEQMTLDDFFISIIKKNGKSS